MKQIIGFLLTYLVNSEECYKDGNKLIGKNLDGYKCAHYTTNYIDAVEIIDGEFEITINTGLPRLELYTEERVVFPWEQYCKPTSWVKEILCEDLNSDEEKPTPSPTGSTDKEPECYRANGILYGKNLNAYNCIHYTTNYADGIQLVNGEFSIPLSGPLPELELYIENLMILPNDRCCPPVSWVANIKCEERSVPTFSPTSSPTSSPSISPTHFPTIYTPSPTQFSYSPTMTPTTGKPSLSPTSKPTTTMSPTMTPTTEKPTLSPSTKPTMNPTKTPTTKQPTSASPTTSPTQVPTKNPTNTPTTKQPTSVSPTESPITTRSPTQRPSTTTSPTESPITTRSPTQRPSTTTSPTESPITRSPTQSSPTESPTQRPSTSPTTSPSYQCPYNSYKINSTVGPPLITTYYYTGKSIDSFTRGGFNDYKNPKLLNETCYEKCSKNSNCTAWVEKRSPCSNCPLKEKFSCSLLSCITGIVSSTKTIRHSGFHTMGTMTNTPNICDCNCESSSESSSQESESSSQESESSSQEIRRLTTDSESDSSESGSSDSGSSDSSEDSSDPCEKSYCNCDSSSSSSESSESSE